MGIAKDTIFLEGARIPVNKENGAQTKPANEVSSLFPELIFGKDRHELLADAKSALWQADKAGAWCWDGVVMSRMMKKDTSCFKTQKLRNYFRSRPVSHSFTLPGEGNLTANLGDLDSGSYPTILKHFISHIPCLGTQFNKKWWNHVESIFKLNLPTSNFFFHLNFPGFLPWVFWENGDLSSPQELRKSSDAAPKSCRKVGDPEKSWSWEWKV